MSVSTENNIRLAQFLYEDVVELTGPFTEDDVCSLCRERLEILVSEDGQHHEPPVGHKIASLVPHMMMHGDCFKRWFVDIWPSAPRLCSCGKQVKHIPRPTFQRVIETFDAIGQRFISDDRVQPILPLIGTINSGMTGSLNKIVRHYLIPEALSSTFIGNVLPNFIELTTLTFTCSITAKTIYNSNLTIKDKAFAVTGLIGMPVFGFGLRIFH